MKLFEYSQGKDEKSTFAKMMNTPSDINKIQPNSMQVWNCNEIGFDTNGKWHKVICTYKFLPREYMWKMQTGSKHHSGAC